MKEDKKSGPDALTNGPEADWVHKVLSIWVVQHWDRIASSDNRISYALHLIVSVLSLTEFIEPLLRGN